MRHWVFRAALAHPFGLSLSKPWHLALGLAVALCTPAAIASPCGHWAAPQVDLTLSGYYVDAQHSEVDPTALQAQRDAAAPGRAFVAALARQANRYRADPAAPDDKAERACAIAALQDWARARALLGRMEGARRGQQAEYERKWLLCALALAYLDLRPAMEPAAHAIVEPWLDEVADAVWSFWASPTGQPTAHSHNNHYAWAGLALAASAQATGHAGHWRVAHQVFDASLAAVQVDGSLPLELARGRRALHYHAFAAAPLVVMAELAAARGEDWLKPPAGAALQRLVDFILVGLNDPEPIARLAQATQERPTAATLAWLAAWAWHDRDPARLAAWPGQAVFVPTLGGDLRLLSRLGWPVRR